MKDYKLLIETFNVTFLSAILVRSISELTTVF